MGRVEEKEGRMEGSEAGFTGFIGFAGLGSLNCDLCDLLIYVICGIASGTRSYGRSGRRTRGGCVLLCIHF